MDKRDTLQLPTLVQDGRTLFFFARDRLMANRSIDVPVVIKDRLFNCTINFRNDRRTAEVYAIDYPVDVLHFDGTADFVGFYGLTGDFEGWFSNDDARIPILAKLQVLIGCVTVELIEWKRAGWVPPRGAQ